MKQAEILRACEEIRTLECGANAAIWSLIAASYGLEESSQFIPCVATPYPAFPLGTLPPKINGIWKGPT